MIKPCTQCGLLRDALAEDPADSATIPSNNTEDQPPEDLT